jgi:hypothetical protein
MCIGGKFKEVNNVNGLQPCECAKPKYIEEGFLDIKKVLLVNSEEKIKKILGRGEYGFYYSRNGYRVRPLKGRVLEFYFHKGILFDDDKLLSPDFLKSLGLIFDGCESEVIKGLNAFEPDLLIKFSGCVADDVDPIEKYDDITKYYYYLAFKPRGPMGNTNTYELDEIRLYLMNK